MTSTIGSTRHGKELSSDSMRNPAIEFEQGLCWLIYRYTDGTFEALAVCNEEPTRAWGRKDLTADTVPWKRMLNALASPTKYQLKLEVGQRHAADKKQGHTEGDLAVQLIFTDDTDVQYAHQVHLPRIDDLEGISALAIWNKEQLVRLLENQRGSGMGAAAMFASLLR